MAPTIPQFMEWYNSGNTTLKHAICAPNVFKKFPENQITKNFIYLTSSNFVTISQGRSEGTSSIAFEVLTINCQIYFINLFIFNCLTLNINLFIFNLFDVKLLFSENHTFRIQNRTAVYGRASLVSDFKLTQKNDDLLSLRHK